MQELIPMGLTPFLHRGSVTLPAELRTPPSLTLHTQHFTPPQDTHTPPSLLLTLPLTVDERVAALAKAGCRNTGLVSTFLVLTTKDALTIGKLNVGTSTYEATATITIPGGEDCLGCWIADGPTVVARYGSKVVVVACESRGCHKWKAEMVEGAFQGVFVAGNQVLCVSASELVRDADLLSFPLPSATQLALYSPTLRKVPLPPTFNPHLITCVAHIRPGLTLPYKLIYGTSEGRLTCCSHDEVIMEVTLEESPLSVTVAEAACGVAVLVVALGGMDRKVVTLFAESLQRINSWTGVHQVLVDDFASTGHDQLLLITNPLSSPSPSSFTHVSLLHPGPQTTNPHKAQTLTSITSALHIRLQHGVKELHAAEHRRSHKMHMLTAACNLMQEIGNKTPTQVEMESIELQASYKDRRFLIVNVKVKDHLFHQPTLFATSLQGFVRSAATCLPSEVNSQKFLLSFPLKECQFPIHIILAAEAESKSSPTRDPIYTQWIHSLDMPQTTDGAELSGTPSEVCEKWLSLMGGAHSQEFLGALVRGVALQTNLGKEQRIMEERNGPLTSMYARDASVVSEVFSELWGPRVVEMVVRFAEVMLEEVRCGDESVVDLQGATDRWFCHLMGSVVYNSFGHF